MRKPIIYIRRRTDIPGAWFDLVEPKDGRFESKIHPFAVDIAYLEKIQNNGFILMDADFIIHQQVMSN